MRTLIVAALTLLAFPALAEEDEPHLSEAEGLRVVHAWTPATDGPDALVYLDIENTGALPRRLTGVEASFADAATIAGFTYVDGVERWQPLPDLAIPANDEVVLAPRTVALQLTGLDAPLTEGSEVEIEVQFDATHLEVHVQVGAPGATQHTHAGHMH